MPPSFCMCSSLALDPALDWSESNPWATHLQEDNGDALASYSQHECPTNVLGGHYAASAQAPEHTKVSHCHRQYTVPCVPQAQVIEIERNAGQSIIVVIPPSHSTQNVRFGRAGNVNLGSNYGRAPRRASHPVTNSTATQNRDHWQTATAVQTAFNFELPYYSYGSTHRLRGDCASYIYPGSEPSVEGYIPQAATNSHPLGAMERVEDRPSRGRKKGVWTGIVRLFRRP
ncbi:hypothetical protein DFP72DRAFT_1054671 [Ephemerocybe angulata]|uniref:Uncharacterized protein n=1 Tax=Ephemerocybe angulata TaxID=980116 RepID=A0A8H6H8D8_9AGAR|nr:hypothetical protein DFP72DRAFT_1054671 [Tulosesus angulatus]